jgi:hypothetical protein
MIRAISVSASSLYGELDSKIGIGQIKNKEDVDAAVKAQMSNLLQTVKFLLGENRFRQILSGIQEPQGDLAEGQPLVRDFSTLQ